MKMRVAMAALAAMCGTAWAQWEVIPLHAPEHVYSHAWAVGPGVQAGTVRVENRIMPAVWHGSSQSWRSLADGSMLGGDVYAVRGDWQGGWYGGRASLWNGTAESRVDLHPDVAGATGSVVRGMGPGQQVGELDFPTTNEHAALWRGTAESFVDLHPAGAIRSAAGATDGVRQGGGAAFPSAQGEVLHAMLWSGSAASAVDLNPSFALQSGIAAMAGDQQAGWVQRIGALAVHAAIWSGSAESAVDLHPGNDQGSSRLLGTTGVYQVGQAYSQAALWAGTRESYVNLHALLPPGFGTSVATSVCESEGRLYIGVTAYEGALPRAFLVVGSVPSPGAGAALLAGLGVMAARRRRGASGAPGVRATA